MKITKNKNKKLQYMTVGVVVILIGVGIWQIVVKNSHTYEGQQEMAEVVSRVGKLAILPNSEEPTLATVANKNTLTDSFLKANAENGDKVLVYVQAQRVYIYRPSLNKLVNIGPLSVDASVAQVESVSVLVRSGNDRPATASTIKDTLTQNYQTAVVNLDGSPAARSDYPTTIVIDLTDGDKYDLVANITEVIGAQRGILPIGESKPDGVDILIITGLDKQ